MLCSALQDDKGKENVPPAAGQKLAVASGITTRASKRRRNDFIDQATAALPKDFIDGPHLPRLNTIPHTSWGWYLIGKGHLQQQQEDEGDEQEVLAANKKQKDEL